MHLLKTTFWFFALDMSRTSKDYNVTGYRSQLLDNNRNHDASFRDKCHLNSPGRLVMRWRKAVLWSGAQHLGSAANVGQSAADPNVCTLHTRSMPGNYQYKITELAR